jgi:hypothetical protein
MPITRPRTISARVNERVRQLAEVAAAERRTTLSRIAAEWIEEGARRELLPEHPESRTANGQPSRRPGRAGGA